MRVLVTGANGFIGKNLLVHLAERKDIEVVCFTRDHSEAELPAMLDPRTRNQRNRRNGSP